ncbi:hypothetical protein GUITHDRAFT_121429 [Guillardia theta CCMP2712]|uniref:Uncharacterized protein n=1 Tax=Guillardia theta (strain CCMP2712) TaxID=905079 RepID=L1I8L5_GUITC|nr:hypothetical protein GUITHDRAFT_121429 [Guillardia theta CCMP2712]EKX32422.1 hypothetical protein GUITHDRAFT_121429 [Guillardia theta CCMP2712]|eukprot:XP_005819402.1 hypothetical protein GUITHDRAFT_121429 [Guillardia theta CCMP2712]
MITPFVVASREKILKWLNRFMDRTMTLQELLQEVRNMQTRVKFLVDSVRFYNESQQDYLIPVLKTLEYRLEVLEEKILQRIAVGVNGMNSEELDAAQRKDMEQNLYYLVESLDMIKYTIA